MIEVDNITIRAGEFELSGASLAVGRGSYGALMGRTGSGKSTLLEAIAGLKRVSSGTICLNGREVTHLKPALRGIGYVPQDAALFRTMTVAEHLEFALVVRGVPTPRRTQRVAVLAELLGIEQLLHRTVHNLSGGERQRVALGRALSFEPPVLLLDEPLSSLDEETRDDMHELLRSVQVRTGVTVLHVTHSRREAEKLADVLFDIRDGKVQCVTSAGDNGQ